MAAAADTDAAAEALRSEARHGSLADADFVRASVRAAAPAFLDAAGTWGSMDLARWTHFIAFLEREGLLADREGNPVAAEHRPTAERVAKCSFL